MLVLRFLPTLVGLLLASAAVAAEPTPPGRNHYAAEARPLLDQFCKRCHAGSKAKGGLRVDDLGPDFTDPRMRARWTAIADELAAQRMPPRKEPAPAPEAASALLEWIGAETSRTGDGQAMPMRRLSRDEYKNTVRELTGVEPDMAGFPLDPPVGGFSNNRRALAVTPVHLELFAELARTVLDRALVEGKRPPVVKWRFEPEEGTNDDHRVALPDGQHPIVHREQNPRSGGFTVMKVPPWSPHIRDFRVPREGTYVIRLRAGGKVPSHDEVMAVLDPQLRARRDRQRSEAPGRAKDFEREYQDSLAYFRRDPNYRYGYPRLRVTLTLGPQIATLAELDVEAPVSEPRVYEVRTWFNRESAFIRPEYAYFVPSVLENHELVKQTWFPRPELWLDWVELEGPIYDAWPPASHKLLLGTGAEDASRARKALEAFMTRAYRRPVMAPELSAKLALYQRGRDRGASFVAAMKDALVAVLTSPQFLFLVEPGADSKAPLGDHELASRLAYFLWSSPPDGALLTAAAAGRLRDPAGLHAETERMLRDPRARALSEGFASEWLGLGLLGANPPVPELYPLYDRHLETSMARETRAYFDEVLRHDRSVLSFLRSDFVVINARLARFYGIAGLKGDEMRVVALPPGVRRGGLATQGAMLTSTSNGTRTSPVKRGVWLLRTLLDSDPGLPVADAGEIPPKVDGVDKASVRKRLEAHRRQPRCARCHDKIDPLGFALENFDAAGHWREQEALGWRGSTGPDDPRVDATAQMPDGTRIAGVEGLQRELVRQSEAFRRCLAKKLYGYALGREMGFADLATVKTAALAMKNNGDTLRALIHHVVASPSFRSR